MEHNGIAHPVLTGQRILIVEDQAILAFEMRALLQQLGCDVVGPVATLAQALEAARTEPLDGAILDVNLDGELIYPVADILRERHVSFLLATGFGIEALPQRFLRSPILEKPFVFDALERMAAKLWAR